MKTKPPEDQGRCPRNSSALYEYSSSRPPPFLFAHFHNVRFFPEEHTNFDCISGGSHRAPTLPFYLIPVLGLTHNTTQHNTSTMVKRTLLVDNNNVQPIGVPANKKGFKRRRTDEFLEKTSNFDSAMRTCRFFETHLAQDNNTLSSSSSSPSTDSIRTSLRQSMLTFELEHRSYCSVMREEARSAIQLQESFRCLSSGIDSEDDSSRPCLNRHNDSARPPPLSMLNLGPEVNHFLKQSISAFAGVPSSNDLQDWQSLDSLLR